MKTIKKLWRLFGKAEKIKLFLLFIAMFIGALLETLGVSLVLPFINVVSKPELINSNEKVSKILNYLHLDTISEIITALSILLILVYLFKNIYLYFMYKFQYKFVFGELVKFSHRLLRIYLNKPYTFHLQKNSAELIRNVNVEVSNMFTRVITDILLLASEVLVIICILLLLLIIEPIPTIIATFMLGLSIWIFQSAFRAKLKKMGKENQFYRGQMIKWANQSFGACKEIKVSMKIDYFSRAYRANAEQYSKSASSFLVINNLPRLFLETVAITSMLSVVIFSIWASNDPASVVSILALFAVSAFRLMPSANRINSYLNSIIFNKSTVDVIYRDVIEDPDSTEEMIQNDSEYFSSANVENTISESIEVKNVSYRYENSSSNVISDISLSIPVGSSVAFVGPSGAGKTTLVDIILGLLKPDQGVVEADGINIHKNLKFWSQKVGYIPQSIYLSDDSITKNVAIGVDDELIEIDKVWRALEHAQLKEFVQGLPEGLNTFVGDRGVRLSGGQRQRIGIARALYHNPEILVLDEATAALDTATEKSVMKAIDKLHGEKTIIIIAHRLSTIENCDEVYEIKDGRVIKTK